MHPNRLVKLMGHGSKKMVYETYGQYVEGLEEDAEKILAYYGTDFVRKERGNGGFGESFGESRTFVVDNLLI